MLISPPGGMLGTASGKLLEIVEMICPLINLSIRNLPLSKLTTPTTVPP